MKIQQCLYIFRITHPACRACNGLRPTCESYAPNPDPKAARETDPSERRKLPEKLFPTLTANPMTLQETRYRPLEGGKDSKNTYPPEP